MKKIVKNTISIKSAKKIKELTELVESLQRSLRYANDDKIKLTARIEQYEAEADIQDRVRRTKMDALEDEISYLRELIRLIVVPKGKEKEVADTKGPFISGNEIRMDMARRGH